MKPNSWKSHITGYFSAQNFLNGRDHRAIPSIVDTSLETSSPYEPTCITLRFHGRPIIRYFLNGQVQVSYCSWMSSTTKRRLNHFTRLKIWQKDYEWYYSGGHQQDKPFLDNMLVDNTSKMI